MQRKSLKRKIRTNYAKKRHPRGRRVARANINDELAKMRSEANAMRRLLRSMVKEYMVEGDADWTRICELIAEDARKLLRKHRNE